MSRTSAVSSKKILNFQIHGLSFLCRPKSSLIEKIFWAFSLSILAAILFSLIFLTAKKCFSKDTVVNLRYYKDAVGDVAFPAVTICPDSLVFENIFEFQNKSQNGNFTEDDFAAYQLLDLLYDTNFLPSNFSTKSLIKTLEKYSQDEAFLSDNTFHWNLGYGDPLSRILTKWGLCYNFNMHTFESLLNNETVSQDFIYKLPSWYENSKKQEEVPWKLASTVSGYSLQALYSRIDNYTFNDKNMFQPHALNRLIVHSPLELPYRTGHHYFLGRHGKVNIPFATEVTTIDKELESWSPEERNCFLENEKKLKFFKIYTKGNCEQHECLSQAALDACGCVPFYMIRSLSDRVCGVFDRNCYSMIEMYFDVASKCQCLNPCEKLVYASVYAQQGKSKYWFLWGSHENSFVKKMITKKVFGSFQTFTYLGSFLALFGGISLLSLLQLVINFVEIFVCFKKKDSKSGIPSLTTRNVFHVLSEKLYHLNKDVKDFIRMSSVHGIQNLSGSYGKQIFWFVVISAATTSCVHFIRQLSEIFNQHEVGLEFDHKTWSAKEIPFPAVIFCPDLNITLLKQHVECRLRGHCDGLNSSQIPININAVKAGCEVCPYMFAELGEIEKNYKYELVLEDFTNRTYTDYFKNFLDSALIDQQSFCMNGRNDLKLRESLAHWGSFCYTIGQQDFYDENTIALDFTQKKLLDAKCLHPPSDLTRTEMKIVFRYSRALNSGWLPTNPSDLNERFNCKSELGTIGIFPVVDFPTSAHTPSLKGKV